jgi:hypothetical protein
MNIPSLVTIESRHGAKETAERLLGEFGAKGLALRALGSRGRGCGGWIGAAADGAVRCAQTIGIDRPLKALAWWDAEGPTSLSYNDPAWILERHAMSPDLVPNLKTLSDTLATLSQEVTNAP